MKGVPRLRARRRPGRARAAPVRARCPTRCTTEAQKARRQPDLQRLADLGRLAELDGSQATSIRRTRRPLAPASGRRRARLPDRVLRWALTGARGAAILVADRVLLHPADRRVATGVRDSSASSTSSSATTGTSSKDIYGALPLVVGTLITSAIALAHRRADRGRGRALRHRAVPAPAARAADHPGRAAGRGAVGRLRPVGRLRAGPEAQAGRAVVRRHVLVPAVRRRHTSPGPTTSSPG